MTGLSAPPPLSRGVSGLAAALFGLGLLAGGVLLMPARWLDHLLAHQTQGALRLADPQGTLWSGSGQLQLHVHRILTLGDEDLAASDPLHQVAETTQIQALPGRLSWSLHPGRIRMAEGGSSWGVELAVSHPSLSGGLATRPLQASVQGLVDLPAGQLSLGPISLEGAGGPLALFRPAFSPTVRWSALQADPTGLLKATSVQIDLLDLSSSLSPVRPLGSYRLDLQLSAVGGSQATRWRLDSRPDAVLVLTGQGQFTNRIQGQIQLACSRQCEFVEGLMAAIGKKNGDVYVANLGL